MSERIISVEEAKYNGVDFSTVDYCRRIRRIAMAGNVKLDDSVHRDNIYNKHLFSYIEYCGWDPLDYIKTYLSNLQPFMLEHRGNQEKTDTMVCVLDNAYRVSLYIKADGHRGNEVIVSFHENIDPKRKVVRENNTKKDTTRLAKQVVPVIAEPTGARLEGSPREQVKVFIQRGMLLFPAMIMAQKCSNGLYLVEREGLEQPIIDACNQYLRDLYASNVKLEDLDNVEIFSVLQQMSFTSYGNTIFSNITLLIDNLEMQNGPISKAAADFTLITYINNLYLTQEQASELIDVLSERYQLSPSRNFSMILNRVTDEIKATANKTVLAIDIEDSTVDSENTTISAHNAKYIPKEADGVTDLAKRPSGR